ncbi:MAG: hypothetical protein Q8P18_02325 [Pseudomonadota bacterium]|nr:hypothetical protein [Pseudomonadota bacterium]
MIWLVAAAYASPAGLQGRADGDAASAARDWAGAITAWQACAAADPTGRDGRYCATRAAALAPHAADGFAGWTALEGVRREYRTLGSDAAIVRVEAALAADPQGPAAASMRVWLANERARRGEDDAVARIGADLAADPGATDAQRAFVAGRVAFDRREGQRRVLAGVGAALGVLYTIVALRGPGPWRWRSAALAALVLGAVPTVFAALYEEGIAASFAASALVVTGAVLLAGRAPRWVSVGGTVGAYAAVAWANGWYPSLGF